MHTSTSFLLVVWGGGVREEDSTILKILHHFNNNKEHVTVGQMNTKIQALTMACNSFEHILVGLLDKPHKSQVIPIKMYSLFSKKNQHTN